MKERNNIKIEDMSRGEIEKFIEDQESKALKLRFDISSKQIKNHREYRNIKREIAKAKTAIKIKKD